MNEEEENAAQKTSEQGSAAPPPLTGHEIFRRYSVLLETSLTVSKLLLLATAFLTVFLSWLAGADLIWVAARGVITTLCLGLVLWTANYIFTQRVMETVMADAKKVEEQVPVSTVERRA